MSFDVIGSTVTKAGVGAANISTAQSKFGGASVFFNGGGYYTIPDSAKWKFGSDDFCVELWFRTAAPGGQQCLIIYSNPATNSDSDIGWFIDADGFGPRFRAVFFNGSTAYVLNGPIGIAADTWYHIAYTRSGGTTRLFINGTLQASASHPASVNAPASATLRIGGPYKANDERYVTGYIDEVRIQKRNPVYTSAFTPPSVAYPNGYDPHASSVILLTRMNGANASTVFTDSSPSPVTVTPNGSVAISTAQSKFNGASAYFDGAATSYLIASGATFDIASADFTVEFWLYPLDNNGANTTRTLLHFNAGSNGGLHIHRNNSQQLVVDNGLSGTTASTATIPLNQFSHIAVTRSGTTIRGFINGVQALTHTAQTYQSATQVQIGRYSGGSFVGNAYGYIDELRITKGVARYTTTFKVPYKPFASPSEFLSVDPYFGSTTSLLHMNGTNGSTTFTDQKGLTWTPAGNAQISTAQSKFGGASALFDGTGDYLTTTYNTTTMNWWTSDFTLEAWVYPISLTGWGSGTGNGVPHMIGNMVPGGGTNYWSFGLNTSGKVVFYWWTGSGNSIASTLTVPTNVWTHIAVVQVGAALSLYVNGVRSGTGTRTTTPQSSAGIPLTIGSYGTGINGYVDELRFTKAARYFKDFTPRNEAFPDA